MEKRKIYLILIFIFCFLLRFAYLSKIPPELNRDEASVGYNAYSILKTGKDEHGGKKWPLVFRAFGDYKIPGYIYLTAPVIKIFGLNAFSVRFNAAFFGSLTILLAYFFVKELFTNFTSEVKSADTSEALALTTSFLLAIAPFHFHYSRQQFEAPVAFFFSLTGALLLLKARRKKIYLWFGLLFFISSFFIYNSPLFIIPLLIIWTFIVFRKEFLTNRKALILSSTFFLVLLIFWLGYWNLVKEGNRGRANTTIFNQLKNIEQINHNLHYLTNKNIPLILGRLMFNKPLTWVNEFFKNYLSALNPKFIFFTGDNNPWHGLGFLNYGNLLPVFLPFMALGIFGLIKRIKERPSLWFLGYLIISLIPNGLTIDSPITTRLFDLHFILICLAAFGLNLFWSWKTKWAEIKNSAGAVLIFLGLVNYLFAYFFVFPQSLDKSWFPGIKQTIDIIKEKGKDYDAVFIASNVEVGYIFAAFYLPFEPGDFQKQAIWEFEGFDKVKQYQKFYFNKSKNELGEVNNICSEVGEGKRVLVVYPLEPAERVQKNDNNFFLYNALGEPTWQFTSLRT